MSMLTHPPPVVVAVPIMSAIDSLKMADAALGETFDHLTPIDIDEQGPLDVYRIYGFRSTCVLFVQLFAAAEQALGMRGPCSPPIREKVRDYIHDAERDERNAPGMERAALALLFAVASFEDALDALDKSDDGNEWYSPIVAAVDMIGLMSSAIESSLYRRPARDAFDRRFFGSN